MQILKNRAFSIIELLVVLIIIMILAFIFFPKLTSSQSSSEVEKEISRLIKYIEKKKAETVSGKYAMTRIWISDKPESGKSQDWQMSNEEWNRQISNGQLSARACPNPKGQYTNTNSSDTFEWKKSSNVISSRKHLCIDREGIISTDGEDQNGIPGKVWLIVCSKENTGPGYSSLCYWNRDKLDYRYVIQILPGTVIQVYKYDIKKDIWKLKRL